MGSGLSTVWKSFVPTDATFTEKDVPDLSGKVYIVTGSSKGVGKGLADILYSKNAKVYIAVRTEAGAQEAMKEIQAAHPSSSGSLHFLRLDLGDLSTIKATAEDFLSREDKLHVLVNNAAVQWASGPIHRTPQGHEIHIGTNTLGPFLLTKLLTPVLARTAASEKENGAGSSSVRVIWVSSAVDVQAEKPVALPLDDVDLHSTKKPPNYIMRYSRSKVGSWLHNNEYARRHVQDGITSVAVYPGNSNTDLYRQMGGVMRFFLKVIMYPSINLSYSLLFSMLSPEVSLREQGTWVWPFGRVEGHPQKDMYNSIKRKSEGGNGNAEEFWLWSEEQVKEFV